MNKDEGYNSMSIDEAVGLSGSSGTVLTGRFLDGAESIDYTPGSDSGTKDSLGNFQVHRRPDGFFLS